jgi:hypothetical protein
MIYSHWCRLQEGKIFCVTPLLLTATYIKSAYFGNKCVFAKLFWRRGKNFHYPMALPDDRLRNITIYYAVTTIIYCAMAKQRLGINFPLLKWGVCPFHTVMDFVTNYV